MIRRFLYRLFRLHPLYRSWGISSEELDWRLWKRAWKLRNDWPPESAEARRARLSRTRE